MPYLLFFKSCKILNCRLLQIIGGALRVNILHNLHVCKAESYPIIVLDDAVLDLYDDDFLPETDPSGPLPITKLWSHIQKLKSEEILLLKEFAVRNKN